MHPFYVHIADIKRCVLSVIYHQKLTENNLIIINSEKQLENLVALYYVCWGAIFTSLVMVIYQAFTVDFSGGSM